MRVSFPAVSLLALLVALMSHAVSGSTVVQLATTVVRLSVETRLKAKVGELEDMRDRLRIELGLPLGPPPATGTCTLLEIMIVTCTHSATKHDTGAEHVDHYNSVNNIDNNDYDDNDYNDDSDDRDDTAAQFEHV
ncbi:MAG: hypothetical protein MHM6MM_000035 [Cercozoa sp. M6MM]